MEQTILFTKFYVGNLIMEVVVGRTCSIAGGGEEGIQHFSEKT